MSNVSLRFVSSRIYDRTQVIKCFFIVSFDVELGENKSIYIIKISS